MAFCKSIFISHAQCDKQINLLKKVANYKSDWLTFIFNKKQKIIHNLKLLP